MMASDATIMTHMDTAVSTAGNAVGASNNHSNNKSHEKVILPSSNSNKTHQELSQGQKRRREGYKHALYKMWHLAYIDKTVFAQSRLQLSQHDVLSLCKECNKMPAPGVYVLPRDPKVPISPSNAVIVDKLQRKHLIAMWRLNKDEGDYRRYVQKHFAVSSPSTINSNGFCDEMIM
jgi:hypothetical protein